MSVRACFVSASGQNAFFDELIEILRGAVGAAGVETELAIDHYPAPQEDLAYLVLPHEYLALTDPAVHPTGEQLRRTVVLNTEQPGSSWFEMNATTAAHAAAVIDINELGVAELERRGVRSRHLPLGYVPTWDVWGGNGDVPRPVEFTFLGGYSPRRARVLARCARYLAGRETAIHLVETARPHTNEAARYLSGERKWRHLASSRILLNVHSDERLYFEWHRVLEAMSNGCVVVSEHSIGFEPLVPGEHFVSAEAGSIPLLIDALLHDDDRLRQLQRSAYDFVRESLPLSASIGVLVEALDDAARTPLRRKWPPSEPVALPRELPSPDPEWKRALSAPTENDVMRMALKRLIVGQQRLERRLAALEHDGGEARDDVVTTHGPQPDGDPRISAVITLYNYEQYVGDALRSIARTDGDDLEVIVVDDASTDRSAEAAREALDAHPWLRASLVRRATNRGLPAGRNLGVELARGEYVFILDADNLVYPHAFDRLARRLDSSPDAAFAYGILETFDQTGSYDLVSWIPWSPDRLRFGNYIDAMTMIRRTALEQVGGYVEDERLVGWEDLDLWCKLAQAGMHGVSVPEIVARYRAGHHSMLSVTNIDASEAWSLLVERHPLLAGTEAPG